MDRYDDRIMFEKPRIPGVNDIRIEKAYWRLLESTEVLKKEPDNVTYQTVVYAKTQNLAYKMITLDYSQPNFLQGFAMFLKGMLDARKNVTDFSVRRGLSRTIKFALKEHREKMIELEDRLAG